MKFRNIIVLLLFFSLTFLASGLVSSAPANPDNDEKTEGNVITESDAGGGDLSGKELAAVIFISLMVTIIIIVAIAV